MSRCSPAPVLLLVLLAALVSRGCACVNCDRRLWSKFLEMMNRCLAVATEQECSSRLDPVISYTKDFRMVYTETMVYSFLKLMDLIYPFMFTLDYEPLDMLHAFLQMKLKAAVCDAGCSPDFPVPVLFCGNCSVNPVPCHWPHICGVGRRRPTRDLTARSQRVVPDLTAQSQRGVLGRRDDPGPKFHRRTRRDVVEPLVAQRWRVAEMIMFPMIAIVLIGLVAVLVIILLWMKRAREDAARCNLGFRYMKDGTVVPTY